jgi:hypothetical protein
MYNYRKIPAVVLLFYFNIIARWITAHGIVSFSFSTGGSPLLYE